MGISTCSVMYPMLNVLTFSASLRLGSLPDMMWGLRKG